MVGWAMCALGALIGLGVSVFIFFAHIRLGELHFWVYAFLTAVPIIVALPMVINDLRYPRINDVTTDVENPPVFVAALNALPNIDRNMAFPEHFGPIVIEGYPTVQPLIMDEAPEEIFQRIKNLLEVQSGWVITHSDAVKGTLEGEVTTSVFRFADDFVIRVSKQDGKARIDMRSKSRDGLVDAGANAKRIQTFLTRLERA